MIAILFVLLSSTPVIADEDPELQEAITTALVSATDDSDGDVRYAAFSALQGRKKTDAIVQAFRRGLDDENPNIQILALNSMVAYDGPSEELIARLISALEKQELASTARRLLLEIGEPATPALLEVLKSGPKAQKAVVLGLLGQLELGKHGQQAVAEVAKLLRDEDRIFRIQAITALQQIGNPQSRDSYSGDTYSRGGDRMAEALFDRYDGNGDGVLTGEELQSMRGGGSSYDVNGDGVITRQEMILRLRGRFNDRR